MYLLSEVAKLIGVSRQSIYKKIDKEALEKYLQDTDKGKVISEKGYTILKKSFKEYLDSKQVTDNNKSTSCEQPDNLQCDYTGDYIDSLKSEIDHLRGVVSEQGQQLINMSKLLENSQVLLKQQQEKIFFLESPPVEQEKRSFWGIFKHS